MVTAVFPAAGQGRRMNVGMNKVFAYPGTYAAAFFGII